MKNKMFKVLIADNDPQSIKIIYDAFSTGFYVPRLAFNNTEAIESLNLEKFDLIIMDMMYIDGEEVITARNIRKEMGIDVPILYTSNHIDEDFIIYNIDLPEIHYLNKPITKISLLTKLEYILEHPETNNLSLKHKAFSTRFPHPMSFQKHRKII